MSEVIILGFGSIEERVRHQVKDALRGMSEDEVHRWIEQWNQSADKYDVMPRDKAPERYTRIFFFDDILRFHHINRRHPFSPDGWAVLIIREPFSLRCGVDTLISKLKEMGIEIEGEKNEKR